MFSFILDLIFPPSCVSCSQFATPLCSDCLSKLSFSHKLICPYCLKKSQNGAKHPNCSGDLDGLIYLFKYDQLLQKIIKQIKYSYYYKSLDNLISFYLQNLVIPSNFQDFLKSQPIIVPVPLHSQRFKERGFNQSYLIAQFLAKNWQLPISNQILIRTKNTQYQSKLNKVNRQKNIKNAFAPSQKAQKLGPYPLKNKNILLVDDIFTTGTTAQACAQVLKKLGANKIWMITLAHGK